jgi:hypothetical protein
MIFLHGHLSCNHHHDVGWWRGEGGVRRSQSSHDCSTIPAPRTRPQPLPAGGGGGGVTAGCEADRRMESPLVLQTQVVSLYEELVNIGVN